MNSLEAKVVILGAQGAGKTSLVVRFVENSFHRNLQSTIGASFLVKKVYVSPSAALVDCVDKLMIVLCDYRCEKFSAALLTLDLGYRRSRTVSVYGLQPSQRQLISRHLCIIEAQALL